jgi:hypothetical protein
MQSALTNFSDLVTTLQLTGRAGEGEHVRQLAGGVSALVGVVEDGHEPWVIKALANKGPPRSAGSTYPRVGWRLVSPAATMLT